MATNSEASARLIALVTASWAASPPAPCRNISPNAIGEGVDQTGTDIAMPSGTEISRFSQTMREAEFATGGELQHQNHGRQADRRRQRQHGAGADRHLFRAQHHDDSDKPEAEGE